MIDFLNLGSDEKSTLAGSEFQTLTIRSVKKFRRFTFPHCALYNLYGCPLVGNDVKVKYLLTSRHPVVWGRPTNFNGFCVLPALLYGI